MSVAIVVPCYDEADRLDPGALTELAKRAGASVCSSTTARRTTRPPSCSASSPPIPSGSRC